MSNVISNAIIEKANNISALFMGEDIIIDLAQLIYRFSTDFFVGYYFEDAQGKIIGGKVVDRQNKVQKLPQTWITIPASEVPQNAVTLSFFVD